MQLRPATFIPAGRLLGVTLLAATATPALAQSFSYMPDDEIIINFDDYAANGLQSILESGSSSSFIDGFAGEFAFWGPAGWTSAGGPPDSIGVGIVDGAGPTGNPGDHALVMQTTDSDDSVFFAAMNFDVRGLRLLGDGRPTGDFEFARQDFEAVTRIFTDIPDAGFRMNIDTGHGRGGYQGDFTDGSVVVNNDAPGSLVVNVGGSTPDLPSPPVNAWRFVGGTASTEAGWGPPSFEPFFSRATRSDQITRFGVTFPGGGALGELRIDQLILRQAFDADPNDPAFLVYNPADFNTDATLDAADIDEIAAALRNLETITDDLNTAENEPEVFSDFARRKYDLSDSGGLDMGDIDIIVREVLNTDFGDVDLDGDVDADDQAVVQANQNLTMAGWADGDMTGDGLVDAADLAVFVITQGLAGDFSGDNFVGQDDLNQVLQGWGTDADLQDGVTTFASPQVGQEELNAVLSNWGNQNGSGPSLQGLPVPEPAGLAALALLGTATLRRRRG
jgi:hypothetical protein